MNRCESVVHASLAQRGMTLVELLVALGIFMALMLLGTLALADFARIASESRQVLTIHRQDEAIHRWFRDHLAVAMPTAAMRLRDAGPAQHGMLTFMRPIHWRETGKNIYGVHMNTIHPMHRGAYSQTTHEWVHLEWGGDRGDVIHIGKSRPMLQPWDFHEPGHFRRDDVEQWNLRPLILDSMKHLVGDSSTISTEPMHRTTDDIRETSAAFNDFALYESWFGRVFKYGFFGGSDKTPTGSHTEVAPGSYAVANPDGRSFNKNWINVVGSTPPSDDFPDQRRPVFQGVGFLTIVPLDLNLDPMPRSVEADELNDSHGPNDSLDWLGISIAGRVGDRPLAARPAAFRISYVLHAARIDDIDVSDEDGDGNQDEPVALALMQHLQATVPDPHDQQRQFQRRLRDLGYASEMFHHVIEVMR